MGKQKTVEAPKVPYQVLQKQVMELRQENAKLTGKLDKTKAQLTAKENEVKHLLNSVRTMKGERNSKAKRMVEKAVGAERKKYAARMKDIRQTISTACGRLSKI